jgi:nitrite reductase/ring-hydroxylating ferredoxin subunit
LPFVKVAELSEIPEGRGTLIEHQGHTVALFNAGGGRIHATSPLCPHEDGPLGDGWIEGGAVVCPWHGFDFDLATGECRVDRDLAITVYPARVTGTAVEIDLP